MSGNPAKCRNWKISGNLRPIRALVQWEWESINYQCCYNEIDWFSIPTMHQVLLVFWVRVTLICTNRNIQTRVHVYIRTTYTRLIFKLGTYIIDIFIHFFYSYIKTFIHFFYLSFFLQVFTKNVSFPKKNRKVVLKKRPWGYLWIISLVYA